MDLKQESFYVPRKNRWITPCIQSNRLMTAECLEWSVIGHATIQLYHIWRQDFIFGSFGTLGECIRFLGFFVWLNFFVILSTFSVMRLGGVVRCICAWRNHDAEVLAPWKSHAVNPNMTSSSHIILTPGQPVLFPCTNLSVPSTIWGTNPSNLFRFQIHHALCFMSKLGRNINVSL